MFFRKFFFIILYLCNVNSLYFKNNNIKDYLPPNDIKNNSVFISYKNGYKIYEIFEEPNKKLRKYLK